MTDTSGRSYIDLLSGTGALNYGHNEPTIIEAVVSHLSSGGIVHSLDMHTKAKAEFIACFQSVVLEPRGLSYRLQFPGPTGTNAVEAAIKLARKVTGRSNVVAFTNAYHGMTLGSLALTANPAKRAAAGLPPSGATFMPYDGALGEIDTAEVASVMLRSSGSGIDAPAAIILELVQGEGGLNVASTPWFRRIAALAKEVGALLIIDDIQAGVGRTGPFFSFEGSMITPDIVVLSKSLSGFGTPFSLVLIRPELDAWSPGEHNGTFRGNNLAFVGATKAIESYWQGTALSSEVLRKGELVANRLRQIAYALPPGFAKQKGRGLFQGLEIAPGGAAQGIARRLFEAGIIIETCGPADRVLKLLPALTIDEADLVTVLDHIEEETMLLLRRPELRLSA
jgi:diaminobutyrate-2-oxoglutarate transaminase